MNPSIGRWRDTLFGAAATMLLLATGPACAATFTVTTTTSSGAGSLSQAILDANALAGSDSIAFAIPGSGPHTISVPASLPAISDTLEIDGFTQAGASANTSSFGAAINAVLRIEISVAPGGGGLTILAPGTTVRGLAINGGSNRIFASDVVIAGNFLGTDAAGTTALGLIGSGHCIQVVSSGSALVNNVRVGGPAAADRNLIVSSGVGVQLPFLPPGPGTGYVIQGNYIGTDITGTLALARGDGLNAISNALVVDNLISGNPFGGIQLFDNTTVQGNLIGTQRDGTTALPNGSHGIKIHGGNSTIGGAGAGDANVIANHAGFGLYIYDASTQGSSNINTRNRISRNSIYANQALGISLEYSTFPMQNDAGDVDTWSANQVGNDGQNYPLITSAALAVGNAIVAGSLNSVPNSAFALEFFANAACNARGHGEGQTYIGTASVSTDSSGTASFGPLSFAVPAGQAVITSTATDAAGNTSEFSQCVSASGGLAPTTTALASSLNPSTFGQAVTFTATVTGASPTGSVQFNDGAVPLATVALIGNVASFTTSALATGTHPMLAVYGGDASNDTSPSPILNQLVNAGGPTATSTSLASSLNPSTFGQSVTFTAIVTGASPGGSVQFHEGATLLATAPLSAGLASFTTSTLTPGSHPLTAAYGGDAANTPSSSPVLTQIVIVAAGGSPAVALPMLSPWLLLVLFGVLGAAGLRRLARIAR